MASGKVLQALADVGARPSSPAAPTSPSNTGTVLKDHGVQSRDEPGGRQIYFGVREHGMAAAMNGMALHGGVLPGRRHVPRVQRLLPAVGPPGRAVAGQGHLLLHPRLRRASARTAPPTSRSSTSPRCGPSPASA